MWTKPTTRSCGASPRMRRALLGTSEYQLVIQLAPIAERVGGEHAGSSPPRRPTGTSPIAGSLGCSFGLETTPITSGARENRASSCWRRPSDSGPSRLLGQIGQPFADLFARLAAIEDEAPRLQPAVIGHARGDAKHRLDLGIARRRLLQLVDRRRDAGRQKFDDVGDAIVRFSSSVCWLKRTRKIGGTLGLWACAQSAQ